MFPDVNIDCDISVCQYPVYSLGSAKPAGQLCLSLPLRSSESSVVLLATSEMHSEICGKEEEQMAELI